MAKEGLIKQDGIVEEALSNANFHVRLENDHVILLSSVDVFVIFRIIEILAISLKL